MDLAVGPIASGDLAAAFFQALVNTGLAILFVVLLFRYRKAHFAYWTLAWAMYSFRIACILNFQITGERIWLYWHQVATGWTALALLWAAMVFALQVRWRNRYWLLVLFPPIWSYVAIYRMDNFVMAALPMVLFLGLAALWTGGVFIRYSRTVASGSALFLGIVFLLWGIHDMDYPFLRRMGAWNPWGYYLDLLFELNVAAGLLLVVMEDQRRGLEVFSDISSDLQESARGGEVLEQLVTRPLTLPGVVGTAIFLLLDGSTEFVLGAGVCSDRSGVPDDDAVKEALDQALSGGRPHLVRRAGVFSAGKQDYSYAIGVPVLRGDSVAGAMVVVGRARDPLASLDSEFLVALGRQVGAALETSSLYRRLQVRTGELERLAARMVHLHEEERRRLSRELHDETAQVFAAVNLELGALRDSIPEELGPRLDRARGLVGTGIQGIRSLTRDLRPPLLDDLGLLPALRALVDQFDGQGSLEVELDAPGTIPDIPKESELALYRALQEGLSNVGRHSGASRVRVSVSADGGEHLTMEIRDDGRGIPADSGGAGEENMGLTGMRERFAALGGTVSLANHSDGGAVLSVTLPVRRPADAGERNA